RSATITRMVRTPNAMRALRIDTSASAQSRYLWIDVGPWCQSTALDKVKHAQHWRNHVCLDRSAIPPGHTAVEADAVILNAFDFTFVVRGGSWKQTGCLTNRVRIEHQVPDSVDLP